MVHLMGVFNDIEAIRPSGNQIYQRPCHGYPGTDFSSEILQGPICENPRIRPDGAC